MTTGSFSNIIGTPRDRLPDISKTNYLRTDVDLEESISENIENNKSKLRRESAALERIAAMRATQFPDAIAALADFVPTIAEGLELIETLKEGKEQNEEAKNSYERANKRVLQKQDLNLDYTTAKYTNDLFKENRKQAFEFGYNIKLNEQEPVSLRTIKSELADTIRAGEELLRKGNFNNITDSTTAASTIDELIELIGVHSILKGQAANVDTDGRKFKDFYNKTIYPRLVEFKESKLTEWNTLQNRNYKSISKENAEKTIEKTLELYDPNEGVLPDMNLLVQTVKEEMNLKSDKEALSTTIRLASNLTQNRRISSTQLNYLAKEFLFTHSGGGLTTFEDSNFTFREADLNYVNQAIRIYEGDPDSDIQAANIVFEKEIKEVFAQYEGKPPREVVFELMAKQKDNPVLRDQPFNQLLLSQMSRMHTGLNFGDQPNAGKVSPPISDAITQIEDSYKKALTDAAGETVTTFSATQNNQLQAAIYELRFKVDNNLDQSGNNKSVRQAVGEEVGDIITNLVSGKYEDYFKNVITSSPLDIQKDKDSLLNDISLITNPKYNSMFEKEALRQLKRYLVVGGELPTYFKSVLRGVKITQDDGTLLNDLEFGIERLKATGGMDATTGLINYKKNYNLTADEINSINYKSSPTKTYNFISGNKEGSEKLLNGFAKERQMKRRKFFGGTETFTQSQEESDNYFYNPNSSSPLMANMRGLTNRSIGQVYNLAKAGYTDFGRYGFTSEEIITAVESGAFAGMGGAKFTEDNQSYMVLSLIRNRANRSNSINGAQTEAKDWHRLINLSLEEQEAVLQIFPNLRGMKNNQFQNLQADVAEIIITEAEKLRNEKAAKKKAEEEARRLKAEQTFNPKTLYN